MSSIDEKTDQALRNYQNLVAKVEDKFEEIATRHQKHIFCQKGCHQCCAPDLSVSPVEKEAIRQFLNDHPERIQNLRRIALENPHQGSRCRLLNAEGACEIYEVRPLICRSHGVPIVFRAPDEDDFEEDTEPQRDVCPLNFNDVSLDALPLRDLMNVDTVNTILTVINLQWLGHGEESGRRTPLDLDSLLQKS